MVPLSKRVLKLAGNRKCVQNFYSGPAVDTDKAREEIRPLLGYYVGCSGKNSFLDFGPFKKGPTGCPETSVRNYHCRLHNIPEEPQISSVSQRKPVIRNGEMDVRPDVMLKCYSVLKKCIRVFILDVRQTGYYCLLQQCTEFCNGEGVSLLRGAGCFFNPLNPELNPICYLLALLGAHHFLHVSRIRVKSLTLRRLMSYI
jgi:hypothetical protein